MKDKYIPLKYCLFFFTCCLYLYCKSSLSLFQRRPFTAHTDMKAHANYKTLKDYCKVLKKDNTAKLLSEVEKEKHKTKIAPILKELKESKYQSVILLDHIFRIVEDNIEEIENTGIILNIIDSHRKKKMLEWNRENIELIIFLIKENALSDISPLFKGKDAPRLQLILGVDNSLEPTIMALAKEQGHDDTLGISPKKEMEAIQTNTPSSSYKHLVQKKSKVSDSQIDQTQKTEEKPKPVSTKNQIEAPEQPLVLPLTLSPKKVDSPSFNKKKSIFAFFSLFSLGYFLMRNRQKKTKKTR